MKWKDRIENGMVEHLSMMAKLQINHHHQSLPGLGAHKATILQKNIQMNTESFDQLSPTSINKAAVPCVQDHPFNFNLWLCQHSGSLCEISEKRVTTSFITLSPQTALQAVTVLVTITSRKNNLQPKLLGRLPIWRSISWPFNLF